MIKLTYNSPLGQLLIIAEDEHITGLYFAETEIISNETSAVIDACIKELDAYFAGKLKNFTVPIKLTGTDFRMKVWKALMTIPYGKTISYMELAKLIGQPTAIRAVGGANHHNPISIIVPCHRVIGANGSLTGYGGGVSNKEFLLNLERQSHA